MSGVIPPVEQPAEPPGDPLDADDLEALQ